MFGELEYVCSFSLKFGKERPFHLRILIVSHESVAGRMLESIREEFLVFHGFLPPNVQVVGIVAVSEEERYLVEIFGRLVRFRHFPEIFLH